MHPRLFHFGPLSIPTSGVLTAIAIVAALFAARITARRLDLDPERVWDLGLIGVITALVVPRLVLVLTNWADFVAHPLWMLGVLTVRSQTAITAGMALAIAAMFTYAHFARLPIRRTLDALAPPFALGYAISSIGAFAAGADFGTPTDLPWGVTFTSRLASLWNGTPLGTSLHPVQLYVALAELCFFTLLAALIAQRDRFRDGEVMGTFLFLSGFSGFFLNFLRGDLALNGFVSAEVLAVAMLLLGGLLWLH